MIKRKSKPDEQTKLFEELNTLEKEGKELQKRIDDTLKKIADWKASDVRKLMEGNH